MLRSATAFGFLSATVALAALAIVACGPSPRMLRQSDLYFERCHSAERDPAATTEVRRQCWKAWLKHYAISQPPERVGHAEERSVALTPEASGALDEDTGSEFLMAVHAAEAQAEGSPVIGAAAEGCKESCVSREATCAAACATAFNVGADAGPAPDSGPPLTPESAPEKDHCTAACESETRVCLGVCL
jgi:hypothetical protein